MARTRIHHFKGFSIKRAGIDVKLDMSRLEKNFNKAQFVLDSAVMNSMVPFMPMQEGNFIKTTKEQSAAIAGTGTVVAAAAPSGRFLYGGKTMVDVKTGSPWAREDAKKVLVSEFSGKTRAKTNLTFSRRGAKAHWFDEAKKKDCDKWVDAVKKTAGGG